MPACRSWCAPPAASPRRARSCPAGCRRPGTPRRSMLVSFGISSTVDASTRRPTLAPSSRSQRGVRSWSRAGTARSVPRRAPASSPRPATRVDCGSARRPVRARPQAAGRGRAISTASTTRADQRCQRQEGQRSPRRLLPTSSASCREESATSNPAITATTGSSEMTMATAAYASTHTGLRAADSRTRGLESCPRARPATRSRTRPSIDLADHGRPGRDLGVPAHDRSREQACSGFRPALQARPGSSRCAARPRRASARSGRPRARSSSRRRASACQSPEGSSAGRRACPTVAPRARAYDGIQAAPARLAAPSSSASRSASHSRRWILPPRGSRPAPPGAAGAAHPQR